jgi:hypothetical protein
MTRPIPPLSRADKDHLAKWPTWDAIQAIVIGVDAEVSALERIWGAGRLITLVSDSTRLRFKRGHALWSAALTSSDLEAVRDLGPKMIAAWRFMAKEADALGNAPLAPQTIETLLPDGTVLVVVASNPEAHAIARSGRACRVVTIEEIGRLLSKHDLANAVLDAFPGSRVEKVTTHGDGWAETWATGASLVLHDMEEAA